MCKSVELIEILKTVFFNNYIFVEKKNKKNIYIFKEIIIYLKKG